MNCRTSAALALLGCVLTVVIATAGCADANRDQWATYLLDVPREPPPAKTRTRRDMLKEVSQLQRDLESTQRQLETAREGPVETPPPPPPLEKVTSWERAVTLLPTRDGGQVDWVRALDGGQIAPRASPRKGPNRPVLDTLVTMNPALGVTFPHRPHTQILDCSSCHPTPFAQAAGQSKTSMDLIKRGESCGICHGPVAFGPEQCSRCHAMKAQVAKQTATPREPRTPVEAVGAWPEALKLLPVTAVGEPDWTRALSEGVIAPRPGIDEQARERPAMDLDLELTSSGSPAFKAVFTHKPHTALIGCDTCHASMFVPRRGASRVTMEQIRQGEACGACHGKVAFGVEDCSRCHPALPGKGVQWERGAPRSAIEQARTWPEVRALLPTTAGAPDWSKALRQSVITPRAGPDPQAEGHAALSLDIEMVPAGSTGFKAVFGHEAHTAVLACDSCHPALFQMKKGSSDVSMARMQAGESCGVCHGKVAFGTDQCSRCHTAMPPEGAVWRPEQPKTPAERVRTWSQVAELLPSRYGAPDWVKALEEGVIAPRAGVDPAAAHLPAVPLDVKMVPAESPAFQALFPHQAHTAVLSCESCHPAIFQMRKGGNEISMAGMRDGKTCGICHGKVAFGLDQCARCHAGLPAHAGWRPPRASTQSPIEQARTWQQAAGLLPNVGGEPDWVRALRDRIITPHAGIDPATPDQPVAPLDIEMVPAEGPAFKTVFSHAAHTSLLTCDNCHPAVFQMKKGANDITMEKIRTGNGCGVCHGPVAFGADRCDRCHAQLGAAASSAAGAAGGVAGAVAGKGGASPN